MGWRRLVTITVRLLGLELLHVEMNTETADNNDGPGDCTTNLFGFTASPGDQRWEAGAGGGEL